MRPRLFLIAFVLALTMLPTALSAQPRLIEYNADRWIEVSGEGSVRATPDFATVTLGVTTTGKDAREAMAANAKSANALVALIKSEGVSLADIQTSDVSISPMFSNQPPAQASAPTIIGYSVSDNVTVTVRDISRLGALLDKAVGAGANAIYGIGYGENDPSALLDKARPLAVADARRKAEIYAGAGGAKIGRLMELTEEPGARPVAFAARAYAPGAAAPTPIEAGQDKLTVTIMARFELTQ
ncbi:MAG TPA: SIMPL domain-containing protein [Roseiarcus sp.]|nr:SIMPL domain-containing protein [Roseiarcus sp.]